MKKDAYLLTTKTAQALYFDTASSLPIIDYHNHLSMADIASDRRYADMTELWLSPDPYKHRLMRICGVPESHITGNASAYDKFAAWCSVFPKLVGTPVFDWSLRELKTVFGIGTMPSADTAKTLWDETKEMLSDASFSCTGILNRFAVAYAAPCASFTDGLSCFSGSVFAPSLRGDEALSPTHESITALEKCTGIHIASLSDYRSALSSRVSDFVKAGCRFSDHAIDEGFLYYPEDGKNDGRFSRLLNGEVLSSADKDALFCHLLRFLGSEYSARSLTLQLHIGAARFTSTRLRTIAGKAGGFAGIGANVDIRGIIRLLDDMDLSDNRLPKTVLFTLNPMYNEAISVLSGSFSRDGIPSIVSQGPAWWWCDHIRGMEDAFESMASYGVLSEFIGMTTDSRSILSFVRHDYFRRVLCGWLGKKVEDGVYPSDLSLLSDIVLRMCYANAKSLL